MWTSLAAEGRTTSGWRCVPTRSARSTRGSRADRAPSTAPGIELQPAAPSCPPTTSMRPCRRRAGPGHNLVGRGGRRLELIVNQLNHERVTLCRPRLLDAELHRGPALGPGDPAADGARPIDREWVQLNLARVHARARVPPAGQLEGGLAGDNRPWMSGRPSTVKTFGPEFYLEAYRLLMEILGPRGYVKEDSPADVLRRRVGGDDPRCGHPHLRRWHEQGFQRPHRHVRPRVPTFALRTPPPNDGTPAGSFTLEVHLVADPDPTGATHLDVDPEVL